MVSQVKAMPDELGPSPLRYDQDMTKRPVESSERSCTLRDVARVAGVSTATVSRVVNGSGTVNRETSDRVMLAIADLKYRPSLDASQLGRKNRGIPRKKTCTVDMRPHSSGASIVTKARARTAA
jgi:hypothetical protein